MTAPFSTLAQFRTVLAEMPGPDVTAREAAAARDAVLTKPSGALGRLEEIALWAAGWQGTDRPRVRAPQIVIFAGNHGVVAQGVSAFPAEVTGQMVANFEAGGAAINQLAKVANARLDVVALDLDRPAGDFTTGAAMDETECVAALAAGWTAVAPNADLLVTGEMGIGNTTSAAALAAVLFGGKGEDWVGRGTGVDDAGMARKAGVVDAALALHGDSLTDPLQALARVGGRELAAMAGAMAAARSARVPVLLDGFICTAAATVLEKAVAGSLDHALAAHRGAEPGHAKLLAQLDKTPLLDLGLRLGEGSGAALAIGVVTAALACHSDMATFAEAGVADG